MVNFVQWSVDHHKIRIDEIQKAEVLIQDHLKELDAFLLHEGFESRGFFAKLIPKGMREDVGLKIDEVNFMKLKPLLGKIGNETLGFRVFQHP